MDDPGFDPPPKPRKSVEGTGPAYGPCPVCEGEDLPLASLCGVVVCTTCRQYVPEGTIHSAKAARSRALVRELLAKARERKPLQ